MRLAAARNLAKVWLLALIVAAAFGGAGWLLGGYRTASVFVFCALLAGLAVYAYADRALLGMLGAREYALAEDPILRSTVDALSAKLGVRPPKLYLIPDPFPRAVSAGRGPQGSAIAVSRALLAVLGPIAAAFVHLLLSPKRELAADRVAAAICGSGEGLADALLRLDRASDLVSFEANPATEPLYTVNPFAEEGLAALFVTHPPLERRIAALRGIAG
jgi:Zn-dependent protease with chaperone function